MTETIRIYLVDDHAVLRAGMRMLLNAEPDMEVIGEAADVDLAGQQIGDLKPDVVLLDVSMPKETGLDGLASLQQKSPSSKFLILTMYNDEQYLRLALARGAVGYVVKQAANEELLSAIRVVHQGGTYLHSAHRSILFEAETTQSIMPESSEAAPLDRLSAREKEILVLLAMGYTNRQAAEKLFLSEKTIETYKSRLMNKLHLSSRIELVRFAIQYGLVKT